jgi:hypothetical protein
MYTFQYVSCDHLFKSKTKCGVIGAKVSLQQSIIQIEQKRWIIGIERNSQKSIIQK